MKRTNFILSDINLCDGWHSFHLFSAHFHLPAVGKKIVFLHGAADGGKAMGLRAGLPAHSARCSLLNQREVSAGEKLEPAWAGGSLLTLGRQDVVNRRLLK